MTPERFSRIIAVLDKRQPDLTVITDEVHKQRNIAAIIRTCDAVGIDQIHCVMPSEGYQVYAGTAASANKWVEALHHSSVEEPITQLKAQGYQILAADVAEDSVHFREVDYTIPTAILMGAEVKGVSASASTYADIRIRLPMVGMVESYNVSVACALILNESQRQREAAGLYRQRRLPKEIFDKRFFQWAHPKLAAFCDERGLDYPAVDEEGEIKDAPLWSERIRSKN